MTLSFAEYGALAYAESVLFVDDGESEIFEYGVVGEDSVSSD